MELFEKSEKNLLAADLLVASEYYSSSIHCYYYSTFQLMLHIVFNIFNIDSIEFNNKIKGKDSHNYLINLLSEVSDELYVIQECGTIFPGIVPGNYQVSSTMKKYFENVSNAQSDLFGNSYVNNKKKNIKEIPNEEAVQKAEKITIDFLAFLRSPSNVFSKYTLANGTPSPVSASVTLPLTTNCAFDAKLEISK